MKRTAKERERAATGWRYAAAASELAHAHRHLFQAMNFLLGVPGPIPGRDRPVAEYYTAARAGLEVARLRRRLEVKSK